MMFSVDGLFNFVAVKCLAEKKLCSKAVVSLDATQKAGARTYYHVTSLTAGSALAAGT